jgi:25S rRNA (uracil2634-N3)-methyltransferase
MRAKRKSVPGVGKIGLYADNDRILTIGDGDFSFSASLAAQIHIRALKESTKIVATSYESRESVFKTYPDSPKMIESLTSSGALVFHDIDARNLPEHTSLKSFRDYFDFIIWNFPCKGINRGRDGQVDEIEENKEMLRLFFLSCGCLLRPHSGEVHITHKTIEPFSWWNISEIAISCGWQHVASVVFDKYLYPGYTNRKALDKKSFPCADALVIRCPS